MRAADLDERHSDIRVIGIVGALNPLRSTMIAVIAIAEPAADLDFRRAPTWLAWVLVGENLTIPGNAGVTAI
jgi:hypothetical protein